MNFSIPEHLKVKIDHILKKKAKSKYIDREIFTLPSTVILIPYDPKQGPQLK